jgi:hypothetical protein
MEKSWSATTESRWAPSLLRAVDLPAQTSMMNTQGQKVASISRTVMNCVLVRRINIALSGSTRLHREQPALVSSTSICQRIPATQSSLRRERTNKKSRPQGSPPKPRRSNRRRISRTDRLAARIRPALPILWDRQARDCTLTHTPVCAQQSVLLHSANSVRTVSGIMRNFCGGYLAGTSMARHFFVRAASA